MVKELQLVTKTAVIFIKVDNQNKIIEAAPLAKWAINKPLQTLVNWMNKKLGEVKIYDL